MNGRNQFVDFVKAISIIGVMIIHSVGFSFSAEDITLGGLYIDNLFRFAVPLFFGVLGYMTIKKYSTISNWFLFFKKKLVHIIIPYFIWSITYFFVPTVYPFANKNEGKEYWWQILNGESEIHLYFMSAYLLFLLFTPVVIFTYRKLSKSTFVNLCIIIIISHLLLLLYSDYIVWFGHTDFWYTQLLYVLPLHWLSYYFTGIFLAVPHSITIKLVNRIKKLSMQQYIILKLLPVYLFTVFIFLVSYRGLKPYATVHLYEVSILALILISSLYNRFKEHNYISYICYLGRNTFPIYLSHVLFLKSMFILLEGKTDVGSLFVVFVVASTLSILYILPSNYLRRKISSIIGI